MIELITLPNGSVILKQKKEYGCGSVRSIVLSLKEFQDLKTKIQADNTRKDEK